MGVMRLNVDTEGLEVAHSALREAERLCDEGFDHVDEVKSRLNRATEGIETYRHALTAALNSHIS